MTLGGDLRVGAAGVHGDAGRLASPAGRPGGRAAISRSSSRSRVRSAISSGASRSTKPMSNSEPWLPTRWTSLGRRDSAARSRSARPETTATVVCGSAASARTAATASGSGTAVRRVLDDRREGAVVVAGDQQLRHPGDAADGGPQLRVHGRRRRSATRRWRAAHAASVGVGHAELGQERPGPVADVVAAQVPLHEPHPAPGLRLRSTWTARSSASLTASGSCGLHRNAWRSSRRGAGELAEHQRAAVVGARRHVLLGHQVHPVSQRGHHHHVGRAVQRGQLTATVRLVQVVHGRHADPAELAVDPADLAFDLHPQCLVVLDPLAARRGDLDHDRLGNCQLSVGEQLAERLEALLDALGVVEPVDAQDDRLRVAQLGADLLGPGLHRRVGGQPLHLRRRRSRSGTRRPSPAGRRPGSSAPRSAGRAGAGRAGRSSARPAAAGSRPGRRRAGRAGSRRAAASA